MKIDTTKIENFDALSAEEKLNAILNYEIEVEDTTKLKNALNKATAEASEFKKALREKQTEAEKLEAERKEKEAEREKMLSELMREKSIADNKAQFLSVGYDDELATKSATAMTDGNMKEIFDGFRTFMESREQTIKANLIKGTPAPKGGDEGASTITKEQFAKMDYKARVTLFNEHPDLYKEFTNGD